MFGQSDEPCFRGFRSVEHASLSRFSEQERRIRELERENAELRRRLDRASLFGDEEHARWLRMTARDALVKTADGWLSRFR